MDFIQTIQKSFGNTSITFWVDAEKKRWTTATEIGRALGYKTPGKGVLTFYKRHKRILESHTCIGIYNNGNQRYETRFFDEFSAHIIAAKSGMPGSEEHILWLDPARIRSRAGIVGTSPQGEPGKDNSLIYGWDDQLVPVFSGHAQIIAWTYRCKRIPLIKRTPSIIIYLRIKHEARKWHWKVPIYSTFKKFILGADAAIKECSRSIEENHGGRIYFPGDNPLRAGAPEDGERAS